MTVEFSSNAQMNKVREAAESGQLGHADFKQLTEYSSWLCRLNASGHFRGAQFQQVCDAVHFQMLRVMVERFQMQVDSLDKQNKKNQRLVMLLAVASFVASIVQIVIAVIG